MYLLSLWVTAFGTYREFSLLERMFVYSVLCLCCCTHTCFLLFRIRCVVGNQTQGLIHARQMLCHLNSTAYMPRAWQVSSSPTYLILPSVNSPPSFPLPKYLMAKIPLRGAFLDSAVHTCLERTGISFPYQPQRS